MVAKSYQNLEQIGEPYAVSGKQYVKVRTKTGATKQVRWYTQNEYHRLYPNEIINPNQYYQKEGNTYYRPFKDVLGFEQGYILLFKGDISENADYFKENHIKYSTRFGWHLQTGEAIPNDLPEGITTVELPWDLVSNEDGWLKTDSEIKAAIESVLYDSDSSEYQGTIGEKIEIQVTVERAIPLQGYYGASVMHIMRDAANNCYVWTTAAKNWTVGTEHHIRGTIKEQREYKRVKQTVLTRCKEI